MYGPTGQRVSVQWKPRRPVNHNGKPIKYASPKGQTNRLDVHPRNRDKIADPTAEVWITEGIKKADSLTSRGLCVIAPTGVFNWRSRLGTRGDWEDVPLKGRVVTICFDADARTNPNVLNAMIRLGNWLKHSKGAKTINYLIVPGEVNGKKVKGVDDFFAAGGTINELRAAATTTRPNPHLARDTFTDARLAETVADDVLQDHFIWVSGLGWLRWDGHRWANATDRRRPVPDDVRFRVVADHIRSGMMLISDGVTPGNEARGYVLRRLLRRAVRSMRLLGVEDRVLPELFPVSRDKMKLSYPELESQWERISTVAYAEEDAFRATLKAGTTIFDLAANDAKQAGQTRLSGSKAFALHDTYGFPIDLTLEMASEQGLSVDEEGFRRLMTEQRDRAKADAKAKKGKHTEAGAYRDVSDSLGEPVQFTGYHEIVSEGTVRGILAGTGIARSAREGDEIELVLDRTPFYAEGGGQLADHGLIELANGATVQVLDVQSPISGLIVHQAKVLSGEVTVGEHAQAVVDIERRKSISRAHTATHMVHKAFREALGETATQAGSENAPGRFRFDFSATGAVPASAMADVEARVNDLVLADLAVHAEVMTQEEARRSGAMALFGEKYGDEVRVVSVGDWARELCGGTHAGRSGQLGVIKLLGESSIGSGVRRVEALVGGDAYRFLAREHVLVAQLSEALKVRPEQLPERVNDIVEKLRTAEKEIERVRVAQLLAAAGQLAANPTDVFGVNFVGHRADGAGAGDVRKLALDIRGRMPAGKPSVVAIIGSTNGKPAVVVAVNDEARAWGVSANALVKVAATALGGSGGGKDDVAQGGGADVTNADQALRDVEHEVGRAVTSGRS